LKRTRPALLLCTALSACKHEGGGVSDAGIAFHPSPRPETHPSAISISNLDSEIGDARDRMGKGEAFFAQRLPGLLLDRASFLGTAEDYDEADAVSAKNAVSSPDDGGVRLTRGRVLGALHRFEDATRELDVAAAHHAPADDVARARTTILLATGRCHEAGAVWPPGNYPEDLTIRGAIEQRTGHAALAESLFERARRAFNDVSPFRFAWLDFERARAFEREGDVGQARAYLEDALAAFPEYAHAAVHLEVLEAPDRAIPRLERVEARATDPDVLAAHADALRRLKRDTEARALSERARARFEDVLAKHPEAYADHAARFFLGAGGDVKRALDLAKAAATHAPSEETLELWLLAARAAGSTDQTCAAVAAADKMTCKLAGSRPAFDAARKSCK
jgi:tetratricopeptide (TPR) repeat protein